MKAIVAMAACLGAIASLAAQQPARDAAPKLAPGTAVMTGIVTTGDTTSSPVRNAVVMLLHVDRAYGDTAITDDQGHFEFRDVPAGRYLLSSTKAGFITTKYGASRPGRAGTPIVIADGQHLTGVTLRLPHGAAIAGRVTGADGDPASDVEIRIQRVVSTGGDRRFEDLPNPNLPRTDDRGQYRVYNLPAGDYVVAASMNGSFDEGSAGLFPTTAADVRWARLQLQSPAASGARGDSAMPAPPRVMTGYTPIYYPNVLQRSAATVVTIGEGEERAGIDMTVRLIPMHTIEGSVFAAGGGTPAKPPSIYLVDAGGDSLGASGVKQTAGSPFRLEGIAPGQYTIVAMVDDTREWAMSDVTVGAQDASVQLTLQPGLSASGRVVFDGSAAPPADFTTVRISMVASSSPGQMSVQPRATTAKPDGSFMLQGLIPGRYRLTASLSGQSTPGAPPPIGGWQMRSAAIGAQDAADVPLDIRAGDAGNIVITFTDRPTELNGQLQDASGRPASDYFIIVFSSDARTWLPRSRRIAETRPGSDGRFAVRGLPPGEYFVAALTDVERDEWFDAGFLRQLVLSAIRVSLGAGETKTQDLKIAR